MTSLPFFKPIQDIESGQKDSFFSPVDTIPAEEAAESFSLKDVKPIAQQFGRKLLSHAIASPRSLAEFISSGSQQLAKFGEEQRVSMVGELGEDQFTKNVLKTLDLPRKLLEKVGYPSTEDAEKGMKSLFEFLGSEQTPIEPQTPGQERAANIGAFAGTSVLGGPKKLIERLTLGTAAGAGAQIGKEATDSLGGEVAGALAVPAFLSMAYQIKSKKWTPSSQELQNLKKFGEEVVGLSPEEITPLLQSEGKKAVLGKIATPTTKSSQALEAAELKLASAYETLKEKSKSMKDLPVSKTFNTIEKFDDIVSGLKKSALPPDEKVKVIQKIENSINHFSENGINAENIIETWQDINKTVNWNAYSGGKKDLASLKKPLKEALHEIDPVLSEDFEKINKLWGNMKNISSKITDKEMKKFVDYGEAFVLLGGIVQGVSSGNWTAVQAALGAKVVRRLSTKMLTDPKYQDLFRKSVNAIKSSNKSAGLELSNHIRKEIEQDDENE